MPVVFISSTSEDLRGYRQAARDAAETARFRPVMMEYFVATGGPPLSECLKRVSEADLVVVIVAYRYGWVPPDQPGGECKSITWLECEHAVDEGKDVLAFLVDESQEWDSKLKEEHQAAAAAADGNLTPELAKEVQRNVQRLKDFKAWLNQRAVRASFANPDDLRGKVGAALSRWQTDADAPSPPERLAELTAHAKRSIAVAAQEWLDTECAPFVVPSLSRREAEHEGRGMTRLRPERKPLTDDEIITLTQGNLAVAANRVRIIGDSGMGKTALLHYCEQQVAAADDGRLPLRLDGLSGYDWRDDPAGLLETIARRVLHHYLPDDVTDDDRGDWLKHLVHDGQVVFLLDALDQTDEQLNQAGLRGFLQSVGVAACPVLITLRPEVEGAAVFVGANWNTLCADGFHKPDQQRLYLGDVATAILSDDDERWQDEKSYERKKQWADLLEIPLLLKMLRELARAERETESEVSLSHLPNRHAVYREAVVYLVRQGLRAMEASPFRGRLYDAGEVDDHLMTIGWMTINQGEGNFTAVLEGRPFRHLRKQFQDVDVLRALQQVDMITRHSVLDRYGEAGLAWRHRSFSEYFAAKYLADARPEFQVEVVRSHARDPRWEWVFRFCLSELDSESKDAGGNLAQALIQHGNPFVVYDAMDRDSIKLPEHLARLCRWLVHRDWSGFARDYSQAWEEAIPPEFDDRWIETLESLFDRQYRDSRCLHAAWQLVKDRDDAWAVGIRERFLDEFPQMLANRKCAEHNDAQGLVDKASFVRCPPDRVEDGKPFLMGSPESDDDAEDVEQPQHDVQITPFRLQRAPVVNLQFELFDPSHRLRRDQYSPDDNHPAIWVSWYMAELFCAWLGEGYRLPTEAEWEYAARAGTETRFWWDNEFDKSKCHNEESGLQHTLPPDESRANPWGLIDMLGNVWEWCLDGQRDYVGGTQRDPVGPLDEASYRVIRGGSWASDARSCRAAYRSWHGPQYRYDDLGFRVAAVPSGGAGKKPEEAEPRAEAEGACD